MSGFRVLVLTLLFASAARAGTIQFAVQFINGFRWCVATSAYQIEGANTASDWWEWENSRHAPRSEFAAAHWDRVQEDADLLKNLGVSDARLSIEWARIEPREGEIDWEAVHHYRDEINQLSLRGIRPIVTLQHFTFPAWVRARGGFEWSGLPEAFARHARLVYREIGIDTKDWITINEPVITVLLGYIEGTHPPGESRSYRGALPVVRGILLSHAAAYHALHEEATRVGCKIRVGITHHLRTFDPISKWSLGDRALAYAGHLIWNWAIPDALQTGRLQVKLSKSFDYGERIPNLEGTQDFLAVNYYTGDRLGLGWLGGVRHSPRDTPLKTDTGWSIYPKGLYRLLVEAHTRYPKLSIFITENGVADASDQLRGDFLKSHLVAIHRAIREGVPVEGYCHWSLLDNYEWSEGFGPKFGLYEVDRRTMERKPRASAILYRELIRNNGF